jgi:hypothetical protein
MLDGSWQRPIEALPGGEKDREGLMAVRFHLPSKVYGHRRAADGVERGNILGWRQETAAALDGGRLEFGAEMDERSILSSTVLLFAGRWSRGHPRWGLGVCQGGGLGRRGPEGRWRIAGSAQRGCPRHDSNGAPR